MSAMSPTIGMTVTPSLLLRHPPPPALPLRHQDHQLTSIRCPRRLHRAGGVIADNTIAQHPADVPLCTHVKRELIVVDID